MTSINLNLVAIFGRSICSKRRGIIVKAMLTTQYTCVYDHCVHLIIKRLRGKILK